MSDSSTVSNASLLQEELPKSARCGGKAFVFLAFVVGLGFAALLSNGTVQVTSSGNWMMQEPTINMAGQTMQSAPLQSMQLAKALPFMQPPKALPFMQPPKAYRNDVATSFRTNALANPSAPAGSGLSWNRMTDIRNTFGFSPPQKCVYVNKHASLCGNIVVLRSSTAVQAEGSSSKVDADKLLKQVTEKWDAVEDKTSAVLYASGAVVALVLANSILSTIDAIPLLPGLLETIGLGYSTWFAYRYLLTKSSREELISDLDELKKRISG